MSIRLIITEPAQGFILCYDEIYRTYDDQQLISGHACDIEEIELSFTSAFGKLSLEHFVFVAVSLKPG